MDLALSHSSPTPTLPQPAHQTRPKSRGGPLQLDEKPSMGLSIRRHAPSRRVMTLRSSMSSPPWVLSTHHFSEALHGPINTSQRVAPRREAVTSFMHLRSPPWTGQPPRAAPLPTLLTTPKLVGSSALVDAKARQLVNSSTPKLIRSSTLVDSSILVSRCTPPTRMAADTRLTAEHTRAKVGTIRSYRPGAPPRL